MTGGRICNCERGGISTNVPGAHAQKECYQVQIGAVPPHRGRLTGVVSPDPIEVSFYAGMGIIGLKNKAWVAQYDRLWSDQVLN